MNNEEIHRRLSAIVNRVAPLTPKGAAPGRLTLSGDGNQDTMDSVAALQLVLAVEEEFGITVDDQDIGPGNFGDLSSLCRFVAGKLASH